jgi:NAD+ synthetase
MLNWENPLWNMRGQLKYYIEKNGIKSLVLGVSGGIDSALVAAIAYPVCKELNIPLLGRSLPHTSNKSDEIDRANAVGKSFCTDYDTFFINTETDLLEGDSEIGYSIGEDEKFNKIALGNIKARLRMIHLYDLAYRNRGMVLSTDNYTELMVGFWTLHGDVGDYGIIQELWKTEVYDLSEWIGNNELKGTPHREALLSCVSAVPTDGLGITSSDLEQLGASTYLEVDNILKTWLTTDNDSFYWDKENLGYPGRIENVDEFLRYRLTLKGHPVIQRHLRSMFKRNNPINLRRDQIFWGTNGN